MALPTTQCIQAKEPAMLDLPLHNSTPSLAPVETPPPPRGGGQFRAFCATLYMEARTLRGGRWGASNVPLALPPDPLPDLSLKSPELRSALSSMLSGVSTSVILLRACTETLSRTNQCIPDFGAQARFWWPAQLQ